MQKKQPVKEKEIKITPYRQEGRHRVYSNHIEINVSAVDLNIKFCDVHPPENSSEAEKVSDAGDFKIPIVSEVVLPLPIAAELKRILNERIKEE